MILFLVLLISPIELSRRPSSVSDLGTYLDSRERDTNGSGRSCRFTVLRKRDDLQHDADFTEDLECERVTEHVSSLDRSLPDRTYRH